MFAGDLNIIISNHCFVLFFFCHAKTADKRTDIAWTMSSAVFQFVARFLPQPASSLE